MTELFQKIFAYAGEYPLASYYNTGYRGEVNCKKDENISFSVFMRLMRKCASVWPVVF